MREEVHLSATIHQTGHGPAAWSPLRRLRVDLLRGLNRRALEGAARLAALHPQARPERHGVERIRDVAYLPTGLEAHRLDVWRPAGTRAGEGRPAVLHIHGGGFSILSKDTHWLMGLVLARAGYVVFNVNYRLVPAHPFPHGLEDVAAAWRFATHEAGAFGGDPERMAAMGESAGANLSLALALALTGERPEPFARALRAEAPAPRAVLPICGLLDVESPERFRAGERPLPRFLADIVETVAHRYTAGSAAALGERALASPLRLIEDPDLRLARPLPPCFTACGTRDPILADTRRLEQALARRGVPVEAHYPEGQPHAYHAFIFRAAARAFWRDAVRFLDEHVRGG